MEDFENMLGILSRPKNSVWIGSFPWAAHPPDRETDDSPQHRSVTELAIVGCNSRRYAFIWCRMRGFLDGSKEFWLEMLTLKSFLTFGRN